MSALSFANALTTLDTILNDASNVTFTTGQKSRAMTKAWSDPYVVNQVWDSSLTFTTGTYQYALPATLTTLKGVYLSRTGSTQPFPEPIDSSLWQVIAGNIQFNQKAGRIIPNGYTLYLKGNYKLTTSDSITPTNMQEYVLALAGIETLKLLMHSAANLFLKNDVSVGELIAMKREFQNDVKQYRNMLPKEYESA